VELVELEDLLRVEDHLKLSEVEMRFALEVLTVEQEMDLNSFVEEDLVLYQQKEEVLLQLIHSCFQIQFSLG
jgi:hypothetical protein